MLPLPVFLLAPFALAASVPRSATTNNNNPSGPCCFTLRSTSPDSVIQQDNVNGWLEISSHFGTGHYCLNLTDPNQALRDAALNACFISPYYQVKCIDQTLGFNLWSLKKSGKDVYLLHDGADGYTSCTEKDADGKVLYSAQYKGTPCQKTKLKAEGLTGTCGSLY